MKSQSYQFVKGPDDNHLTIGFGSFGMVKLATNTETKQLVAIKLIYGRNAKQQAEVQKRLEHPNIVKLTNYYFEKQRSITFMVLEYIDGGSLFTAIRDRTLEKSQIKTLFREVCEAISFLHTHGIMHRDIKPQNILISKSGHAKLCDFGFAVSIGERKSICGTCEYMAPEMIQNEPYDYKVDVWALGILLFQMIQGAAPFKGQSQEQVIKEMRKNLFFTKKFTFNDIQLIKSILRVNPTRRPDVSEILKNKWFLEEIYLKKKQTYSSTEVSAESPTTTLTLTPRADLFGDSGVKTSFSQAVLSKRHQFTSYGDIKESVKSKSPEHTSTLRKQTTKISTGNMPKIYKQPTTPGARTFNRNRDISPKTTWK